VVAIKMRRRILGIMKGKNGEACGVKVFFDLLFTIYCMDDELKADDLDWTRSMNGKDEKSTCIFSKGT
jgi:hypothetical protein